MKKRTLLLAGAALCSRQRAIVVAATRGGLWRRGRRRPGAARGAPHAVPVEVAPAVKKTDAVRIEALGTVTPIASVAVKTRIDTEIIGVHFRDGAMVRRATFCSRSTVAQIEAQIKQVEGLLAGAKAQLEQAERDVPRYTELLAKNATTMVTLNNAQTQVNIWRAAVDSNTGHA